MMKKDTGKEAVLVHIIRGKKQDHRSAWNKNMTETGNISRCKVF